MRFTVEMNIVLPSSLQVSSSYLNSPGTCNLLTLKFVSCRMTRGKNSPVRWAPLASLPPRGGLADPAFTSVIGSLVVNSAAMADAVGRAVGSEVID